MPTEAILKVILVGRYTDAQEKRTDFYGHITFPRLRLFVSNPVVYAPANATISASMRSVCVYGRAWAAFSYTNNRLPAMSS